MPNSLSRRFCNIFPVFIWYSGHSVNISLNFKQLEVKTDIYEKFNEDNETNRFKVALSVVGI